MAIEYFPAYQMLRLPFDFQVKDRLDNPAIYIVNAGLELSQELTLHLKNTAGKPLYFAPIDLSTVEWEPTSETCHFELRFRKGVLSNATLGTSKDKHLKNSWLSTVISNFQKKSPYQEGSWAISKPKANDKDEWVSIYLTRIIKGRNWILNSDEAINITLTNISAALGEGTRETRIAIFPRQIYYPNDLLKPLDLGGGKKGSYPVTEPKEQVLQIINQLGRPNIPLHVGFIGPNKVLNDGTQHSGYTLTLRILNTSHHDSIEFDEKSHFIFEFEHAIEKDENGEYEDMEEALGTPENLGKISFHYTREQPAEDNYLMERPDSDVMAKSPHWVFYPLSVTNKNGFQFLEYEKHWDIVINLDQFSTIQPAGITFLKIKHINIPGYWDGELRAPIEKTPLLIDTELIPGKNNDKIVTLDSGIRSVSLNGNLGLGTTNPASKLHVFMGASEQSAHADSAIVLENKNRVYLNLLTPNNKESGVLFGNTVHAGVGGIIYNNTKVKNGLLFKANWETRMVIDANGNVGIGTPSPTSKLHVFMGASNTPTHNNAAIVLENNNPVYLNLLAPSNYESGILFGHSNKSTHGGIIYNHGKVKNGLSFRTNGNVTRMVIDAEGKVGIGTSVPANGFLLDVAGPIRVYGLDATEVDQGGIQIYSKKNQEIRLSLGASKEYSWIQTGFGKPFYINPNAGDVVINRKGGTVFIGSEYTAKYKGESIRGVFEADLHVYGTVKCQNIKIGETEIGEKELQVLKKLAAGELNVHLRTFMDEELQWNLDLPFLKGIKVATFGKNMQGHQLFQMKLKISKYQ